MPIAPEYLPSELHYIIPLADQHGSEARVAKYDRRLGRHVAYGDTLSPAEIAALSALYVQIRSRGHSSLINNWYHSKSGKGDCPAETSWPVYGLLCLFRQLAKLNLAPFNDGAVGPEEKKPTLDWSKLPESLRYLVGPAEVYGSLQFEERILEYLQQRMTPTEQAELQALAQQFAHDAKAIDQWLDDFSMTEHPEARLVYFTGELLATAQDLGLLN